MESNQITCPQCGLKNNCLADACVQCGIIFVKSPEMTAARTAKDDQQKKAIEEVEAMLDQTQPPNAIDAIKNEIVQQSEPPEDTIEIMIPEAEDLENKPQASAQKMTEPNENPGLQTTEIEMEDIETPVDAVADIAAAEELFLTEVNGEEAGEPWAAETGSKPVEPPPEQQDTVDQKGEMVKSDTAHETNTDKHQSNQDMKPLEIKPPAEPGQEEAKNDREPEATKSESSAPAEARTPFADVMEPAETDDPSVQKDNGLSKEQDIKVEENVEPESVEDMPAQIEMSTHAAPTIEMPEISGGEDVMEKQKEEQVREALKKQREAQARAESAEKEQAAEAKEAALKKRKLDIARAEALLKQRAAQAKALKKKAQARAIALKKQKANQAQIEALKKQKAAQKNAQAAAREIQAASNPVPPVNAASHHQHERLLGLLKRYKGKAIGINYDNSSVIKEAELVDANEEFFSVMVKDKKLQYNYPLKTILTIVEGREGVETGEDNHKAKFDAVIKVYPMGLAQ